jgi:hypothetical protein
MIERLSSLPDHVVGLLASGQVTAADYESVLIPAIESMIQKRRTVRLLYQIGPTFTGFTAGAMWDDAKVGVAHLTAWERVAVVTDLDWIATAVKIFRFAIPGVVKVFSNAQYQDAVCWIAG